MKNDPFRGGQGIYCSMIYSLSYLINAIIIGILCIGIGYLIGNVRGKMKTRQQLVDRLPYINYDRES